jgi:hypothetical protein
MLLPGQIHPDDRSILDEADKIVMETAGILRLRTEYYFLTIGSNKLELVNLIKMKAVRSYQCKDPYRM